MITKAFYKLLENYTGAPVLLGHPVTDKTPIITIEKADETFIRRRYINVDGVQYLRKRYNVDIWLNVWANNERERHQLNKEVENRILEAETNHYTTCNHYHDGECTALPEQCTGENTPKKQCPHKPYYKSFFKTNHIIKPTFKVNGTVNQDELQYTQPILRTIHRINLDYYTYKKIGGIVFKSCQINLNGGGE